MGKKTRTRKTKWRQLSLGDASGPEEEDDEQLQHPHEITHHEQHPDDSHEQHEQQQQQQQNDNSTQDLQANNMPVSSTPQQQQPQQQQQQHHPMHHRPPPFRRGPRFGYHHGGNNYGRNNSWTNGSHSSGSSHNGDQPRTHGIEKKFFNDEEYTKISTPRQEVLFKKGSIGKKKVAAPPAAADNEDALNGNSTGSAPLTSSNEANHHEGGDGGSTGDASSTAGEIQSPDAASQNYDSNPMFYYPAPYDYYGGYGPMYPGGILLQPAYPGGPMLAAVPLPVQPVDWYGMPPPPEGMTYYYAMAYPLEQPVDVAESSRRNSVESSQACSSSQETSGEASMSNSFTTVDSVGCSPCSTGPSSQGPASPQTEPDTRSSPEHQKMALPLTYPTPPAGYIYPGYTVAPAVFSTGSNSGPHSNCLRPGPTSEAPGSSAAANGLPLPSTDTKPAAVAASTAATWGRRKKRKKKRKSNIEQQTERVIDEGSEVSSEPAEDKEKEIGNQQAANINDVKENLVFNEQSYQSSQLNASERENSPESTNSCKSMETDSLVASQPENPSDCCSKDSLEGSLSRQLSNDDELADAQEEFEATAAEDVLESALEQALLNSDGRTDKEEAGNEANATEELQNFPENPWKEPVENFQYVPEPPGEEPLAREDLIADLESSAQVNNIVKDDPEHVTEQTGTMENDPAAAERLAEEVIMKEVSQNQVLDEPTALEEDIQPVLEQAGEILDSVDSKQLVEKATAEPVLEEVSTNEATCSPPDQQQEALQLVLLPEELQVPVQDPAENVLEQEVIVVGIVEESVEVLQTVPQQQEEPELPVHDIALEDTTKSQLEEVQNPSEDILLVQDAEGLAEQEVLNVQDLQDVPGQAQSEMQVPVYVLPMDSVPELEADFDSFDPGNLEPPEELWKTVIMEESEPNSETPSRKSSHGELESKEPNHMEESGIPEVPVLLPGSITTAVTQWLESAPVEQQLIPNTDVLISDTDSEDDFEVVEHPKNGETDPCTAPSSNLESDGPQLRVGSDSVTPKAAAQDPLPLESLPSTAQEQQPEECYLDQTVCDPSKFSKYYQLGITVEDDDEDTEKDVLIPQAPELLQSLDDPSRIANEAPQPLLVTTPGKKSEQDSSKRGTWRRTMQALRAAHILRSGKKTTTTTTDKDRMKRLKSGQACCIVQ